jgi:hypothetical protein
MKSKLKCYEQVWCTKIQRQHSQKEGIDYEETFSPIACLEAIRILLAISVAKGFKLYKWM